MSKVKDENNLPVEKINGTRIFYEIHGKGFPVVLIPGLTENSDWWDERLINELSKYWMVVLHDNRGTGRSENNNDYTLKDLAEDIVTLMNLLNFDKAHVIGHSMGGMIAQDLVLNHPERICKLILYSTSCGGSKYVPPSRDVLKMLMADKKGKTPREIVKDSLKIMFTDEFSKNNPKQMEKFIDKVMIARISYREYMRQMKAIFRFKSCRRLKSVSTPTLVIHGKKDVLSPYQNAENISKLIPGAQMKIFENSAHMIFEENFEDALNCVMKFLK